MTLMSDPNILMPTGVRTPVVSISIRALTGIVQAFDDPGSFNAVSICSVNCSVEMWSGLNRARKCSSQAGAQVEYHVSTFRHCDCGFRATIVSIIENGAGSVDVSARPALPNTDSTSGNWRRIRSWTCIRRCASATEMPGRVDGM